MEDDDEEQQRLKKENRGRRDDYLPERNQYEKLCRGEGVLMVSRRNRALSGLCDVINVHSQSASALLLSESSQAEPPLLPLL